MVCSICYRSFYLMGFYWISRLSYSVKWIISFLQRLMITLFTLLVEWVFFIEFKLCMCVTFTNYICYSHFMFIFFFCNARAIFLFLSLTLCLYRCLLSTFSPPYSTLVVYNITVFLLFYFFSLSQHFIKSNESLWAIIFHYILAYLDYTYQII